MKINKGKPHWNGVGKPEGEARGEAGPFHINYRKSCQLQTQQKNPQRERIICYRPQQGKMCTASPTSSRAPLQLGRWDTIITLNTCFSPNEFYSKSFLLLLHKTISLSLVCWICLWFCHSLQITILCYSWINALWWYDNCLLYFLRSTDPTHYSTDRQCQGLEVSE